MIENSTWLLGEYMFTNILGPILDRSLFFYRFFLPIHSLIPGNNGVDFTIIDFRQTETPVIEENYIDFYSIGEMLTFRGGCDNFDPEPMTFLGTDRSHFVMSDTAATCIAN